MNTLDYKFDDSRKKIKIKIPTISQVEYYQPYFVILFLFDYKIKNTLSIKEIHNFAYEPIRFDIIDNYQQIDWNYYRNITQYFMKHGKYIRKKDIEKILSKVKIKREKERKIVYTDPHIVRPLNVAPIHNYIQFDSGNNDNILTFNRFIKQSSLSQSEFDMESVANYTPNDIINIEANCIRPWHDC